MASELKPLQFCEHELVELSEIIRSMKLSVRAGQKREKKNAALSLNNLRARLDALTDKYLDGDIEKDIFMRKKEVLLHEIKLTEEKILDIENNKGSESQKKIKNLELLTSLYLSYFQGDELKKRRMVKLYTSNRYVDRKNVMVKLISPFQELSEGMKTVQCDLCRGVSRTSDIKINKLQTLSKIVSEIFNRDKTD